MTHYRPVPPEEDEDLFDTVWSFLQNPFDIIETEAEPAADNTSLQFTQYDKVTSF